MISRFAEPRTSSVFAFLALAGMLLSAPLVLADADTSPAGEIELIQPDPDRLVLIEPGPVVPSVLYEDGSVVEMETHSVWQFISGTDTSNLTIDDLRAAVNYAHEMFDGSREARVISDEPRGGLNIVWNMSGGLSTEAQTALETAAQYVENQFGDPVTVTINVSMYSMDPYTLGWTQSVYAGSPSWSTTRSGLIFDMDADDVIQDYLPAGSTIPVRYNGASDSVSNENRCYFTKANYNAAIGSQTGYAATMAFNSDFNWDYDPSNGMPGYKMCFISVVVHEVGHALGFTSAIDHPLHNYDIEALDIFRFQRTDGTGDYNPDTYEEFQTTPRTVDYDTPNDDANTDLIEYEWRMADGNPDQASHFREQYPVIGIMDPAQAYGETFYPDYFTVADASTFDAIGWDYPAFVGPVQPGPPHGGPKNRHISFVPNNGELSVAFELTMTAGPGGAIPRSWVGEPDAGGISRVVSEAFYTDAWPSVVHVADCVIVPMAVYELRATPDGVNFSGSYEVATIDQPAPKWWADVVGENIAGTWTSPNGEVNMDDVQATIQVFENDPDPLPWYWVDIAEEVPDKVVNFTDIQMVIGGFAGEPYPYSDPSDCP